MTNPDYDIIILALARWDAPYSSTAFSMAKELSRSTRVFYIDNPFTLKDFIWRFGDQQIKKRRQALVLGRKPFVVPDSNFPNLVAATPQLIIPNNWLPAGPIYERIARFNDKVVYKILKRIIKQFGVKKFVFINSLNPFYGRFFPGGFSPLLTIYQCVDDIRRSAYVSKHGWTLEVNVLAKSDMILVTSMELMRLKIRHFSRVHYLPNAADVELFQKAFYNDLAMPNELAAIPAGHKIILYMGNICHRLDYELLKKIAEDQQYVLLMVGPTTNDKYKQVGLDRFQNVIFTGKKKLEELPLYLKRVDCCIIPFLRNELTRSIYPLKINEYLSAGKPVVTTNFSEDIATFAKVAYVVNTHEDFLASIRKAVSENSREKELERVQYAAGNNWKSRAQELLQLIDSTLRPR